MNPHHPANERIKRRYLTYLKEAKRQSEPTVDAAAKAISRFEIDTKHRDFKAFHVDQAIAFKKHFAEQRSRQSGEKLSKATLYSTLTGLKRFFQWLADQPGYKSRLTYSDAEYFNLSEKESRVATARRERPAPTLEQINHVIASMPRNTEIERRNRALIAFTLLTGARDSATASMKLKHVDLATGSIYQDAREVQTKFSKSITTYFFPVGDEARKILVAWVQYLREEKLWGNDDPLFPATEIVVGAAKKFEAAGLARRHWSNATPIRSIFRDAFLSASLPYFNPHGFRKTLVMLAEVSCKTPEEFKAWSQNLGHEGVLTTFYSYGEVAHQRQAEIIRAISRPHVLPMPDIHEFAKALARELHAL